MVIIIIRSCCFQLEVLPSSQPTNQGHPLCLLEVLLLILQPWLGFIYVGCIGIYLSIGHFSLNGFVVGHRPLRFKEDYFWSEFVWFPLVTIFDFTSDSSISRFFEQKHSTQNLTQNCCCIQSRTESSLASGAVCSLPFVVYWLGLWCQRVPTVPKAGSERRFACINMNLQETKLVNKEKGKNKHRGDVMSLSRCITASWLKSMNTGWVQHL